MILAIDPGSLESGAVIWTGKAVTLKGVFPNEEVLRIISTAAQDRLATLAIEQIGHYGSGISVGKDVFDTCRWIGRFEQRWSDNVVHKCQQIQLVMRATVKAHLCGTSRAKDANVRTAVFDRLGKPGTKAKPGVTYGVTSHAVQALALAVYVADMQRIAA